MKSTKIYQVRRFGDKKIFLRTHDLSHAKDAIRKALQVLKTDGFWIEEI